MIRPFTRTMPLAATLAGVLAAGCGGGSGTATATPSPTDVGSGALTGAGSTFVNPFFQAAFAQYTQLHSGVTVNYQGVGSGAGIQQFTKNTVDFGATDVPMAASEITAAGGADTLVQIPVVLGVTALAYNLAGVDKLQLDGPTIAGIYLGTIKTWDDPAIKALNSGVTLPSKPITAVHRSDGSGTTYIFTDYLSKVSDTFKSSVGTGKSVSWPGGVAGKGTDGVAAAVTQTDGAIGYVELAYVVQTNLHQAYVKNQAGNYLQASVAGGSAAAAAASNISATNFSIVNEPGTGVYPISGFSWALLRTKIDDKNKAKELAYLFQWIVGDGQQYGKPLQYAPLPSAVQQLAVTGLKTVTSGGVAILS
ncbi:MAG: phosphate ABC transporter substrate-binding protein PstS [Candidatus Dormibacteria bacterium]